MVAIPVTSSQPSAAVSRATSDSLGDQSKGLSTFAQMRVRFESDPHKKAAIEAARRSLAHVLGNSLKRPLATLRLSAGLSQAGLAELVGTPQVYISQLEAGSVKNIEAETLRKLGVALNVSGDVVKEALYTA